MLTCLVIITISLSTVNHTCSQATGDAPSFSCVSSGPESAHHPMRGQRDCDLAAFPLSAPPPVRHRTRPSWSGQNPTRTRAACPSRPCPGARCVERHRLSVRPPRNGPQPDPEAVDEALGRQLREDAPEVASTRNTSPAQLPSSGEPLPEAGPKLTRTARSRAASPRGRDGRRASLNNSRRPLRRFRSASRRRPAQARHVRR